MPESKFQTRYREAREAGDADAYAQTLIEANGLARAKRINSSMDMEERWPRPGFWKDVAALLNLETQSDEGAE